MVLFSTVVAYFAERRALCSAEATRDPVVATCDGCFSVGNFRVSFKTGWFFIAAVVLVSFVGQTMNGIDCVITLLETGVL